MLNIKSILLIYISILAFSVPAIAQTCATTETGRQVVLWNDRSWEYTTGIHCESSGESSSGEDNTTTVLIGDDRYPAGVMQTIIDRSLFQIKAQIVNKDGQTLFVLWHERETACVGQSYYFGRPDSDGWSSESGHDVRLFLDNSGIIDFIDRSMKGRHTLSNSRTRTQINGVETRVDVCQEWIAYQLTSSEIEEMRGNRISRMEISPANRFEDTEIFPIEHNQYTLANQIEALGL